MIVFIKWTDFAVDVVLDVFLNACLDLVVAWLDVFELSLDDNILLDKLFASKGSLQLVVEVEAFQLQHSS